MQRIVVPTDGSPLSERALPLAGRLAREQGADMVMVRVIDLPWWMADDRAGYFSNDVYEDLIDTLEREVRHQLEGLVARMHREGFRARWVLRHGNAPVELLQYEEQAMPDLVVMSTHGRTGLARFALGSVADRLVREGRAPVLLVRSVADKPLRFERALVALDGSALAEESLPVLAQLAAQPIREAHLLRAVCSGAEVKAARAYLDEVASRVTDMGLRVTATVAVGPASQVIQEEAATADVLVLTTHGRGGFDRLRHGSVAERATRHVQVPTLLVRARVGQSAETG